MVSKLLVLGDSHAHVFKAGKFAINFPQYDWSLCYVMGATLLGLTNPESKTNAMDQYLSSLESEKPDIVITLIGEIDIGFHVWFRSKKKNDPIQDTFARVLENYKKFWNKIKVYTDNIVCVSVPLPTIPDEDKVGDVALSRKFVEANQLLRTNTTLDFNRQLQELANSENVKFLNLDNICLGGDGLVSSELMHPNRFDHHYFGLKYSNILVEELKNIL